MSVVVKQNKLPLQVVQWTLRSLLSVCMCACVHVCLWRTFISVCVSVSEVPSP